MRTSEIINCVAERVTEHLLNATHGGKLTEMRSTAIISWAERVKDTGATIDDVKK